MRKFRDLVKTLIALLVIATLSTSASASTFTWTNSNSNNDFADLGNWSGTGTNDFGDTDDYLVDMNGANKAVLSATLPLSSNPDDIKVGNGSSSSGELLISGGVHNVDNTFRAGLGTNSTAKIDITGGTINVPNTYTTFGDGDNAVVTMNMSGGALNVDRTTWAQQPGDNSTLNLSGGVITAALSDPSPSSGTSGSLRLGAGTAGINIGGTGIYRAEVLIMESINSTITLNDGGLLDLTGSQLFALSGGTIPNIPTLQITAGSEIAMEGGVWTINDDFVSEINGFISDGTITHSGGSQFIDVSFANGITTVTTVPEPASLGLCLIILGGLVAMIRRKR